MKPIVIIGPTGSGKSTLAMELAELISGEIVSCDSVQIYRGFDIGSAKPSSLMRQRVPHHFIDLVSWREDYDAAKYALEAGAKLKELAQIGKRAIIVGGTGLYLRALVSDQFRADLPHDPELRERLSQWSGEKLLLTLKELDPTRASAIHHNDLFRLARAVEVCMLTKKSVSELFAEQINTTVNYTEYHVIKISPERSYLHELIAKRAQIMIDEGLTEETRSLLAEGCPSCAKPMQSIGYRQVNDYLGGAIPETELKDRIIFATRQYAKRQETWFKKIPFQVELTPQQISSSWCKQFILERLSDE